MNVLFTNAGRRTYLVGFALDLTRSGYPLNIHVSDCTSLSASMHVAPEVKTHILPPVLESPSTYLTALFHLVQEQKIDVLFPLSDLDPLLLARQHSAFEQIGCKVIVGSVQAIECCDDKAKTFTFCRESGLPTPDVCLDSNCYRGPFPAFQKYRLGSGSSGIKRIASRADITDFVVGRDMLQPFIAGEEFGLDILNALDGEFVAVCVKRKLLMRAGETDKAQIIRDEELEGLGRRISKAFGHIGNLDCDVLRAEDGRIYCIDFNPRFGGGYPATHLSGYNYLKAILDMVRGERPFLPSAPRLITVMKGISLHWCDTP